MSNSFISMETIKKILGGLVKSEDYAVFAPVRRGKTLDFAEITDAMDIIISDEVAYKSPKEALLPQVEKLMSFKGGDIEENIDDRKTIIFGAKPCDAQALRVLNAILASGKFEDAFYKRRFENSVLITVGCIAEKPGCFCSRRGVDKAFSDFSDVMLNESGDGFMVSFLSEKGKTFLDGFEETKGIEATPREAAATFENIIELDKDIDDSKMFDIIDWEKATEICQGCGMCTFICPSCHCFDIKDVTEHGETNRYRCWDSCIYPKFTLHASGHNPRPAIKERYRQRVLHKYLYINKNFGYTACTGCGRCIRSCPAGMNIKKVVESIMEVVQ